jgi:membrane associated rhomboid family serine protease
MKITFQSPFIIVFSLLATLIYTVFQSNGMPPRIFVLNGTFVADDLANYVSCVGYTLGHANVEHLMGNMSFFLLLGPILEAKYGTKRLLFMSAITAVLTAVIHLLFFNHSLIGASGIVFMFIILSSLINIKNRELPFTFICIVFLFLGQEICASFRPDSVSQMAHVSGGLTGIFFGYYFRGA